MTVSALEDQLKLNGIDYDIKLSDGGEVHLLFELNDRKFWAVYDTGSRNVKKFLTQTVVVGDVIQKEFNKIKEVREYAKYN